MPALPTANDYPPSDSGTTNVQQQTQTDSDGANKIKGPPQPPRGGKGGDPNGGNTVTGRYPASV